MRQVAFAAVPLLVLSLASSARAQLGKSEGTHDNPTTAQISEFVQVMEKYLYLIDHLSRLAENPTASGIAAVVSANDMLKTHPQDAINYFNSLLPDVKNESVRRAIRIQLADLYKTTHQQDKALEQLRDLIISAPQGPRTTRPPLPQPTRRENRGTEEQ